MTHLNRLEWDLVIRPHSYWSWCALCFWHLIFLLFRFCGWRHFHSIFYHTDIVPATQSLAVDAVNWVDVVTCECPFTPLLRDCKRQIAAYDTSSNCQAMKWAHRASMRGSVKLGLLDAGSVNLCPTNVFYHTNVLFDWWETLLQNETVLNDSSVESSAV